MKHLARNRKLALLLVLIAAEISVCLLWGSPYAGIGNVVVAAGITVGFVALARKALADAPRAPAALIIIVASSFGAGAWYWTGQRVLDGSFVRWQALPAPPESAVKILGFSNAATVVIQTVSGAIYSCCWQATGSARVASVTTCGTLSAEFHIRPPRLPGSTIDCAEYNTYQLGAWFDHHAYVIHEDGTLWHWHHEVRAGEGMAADLWWLGGPVTGGSLSVLAIWVVLVKMRKVRPVTAID